MRGTLAIGAAILLAACVPAEVVRSRTGQLAYRTEHGIVVLNPDLTVNKRFDPLPVEEGKRCEPAWLDWSPDGKSLAFTAGLGGDKSMLGILDPATGKVRILERHEKAALWFPRWSPDGKEIGYVRDEGDWEKSLRTELRVSRLEDGSSRVLAKGCGLLHAWSPDGKRIAYVRTEFEKVDDNCLAPGTLTWIDLEKGKSTRCAAVMFSIFSQVSYDSAGRILLSTPRLPAVGDDVRHALYSFDGKLKLVLEEATYRAASPSGKRSLLLVPDQGEFLEGEVRVTGEGLKGTVSLGKQSGDIFPFWLDENRIGLHTKDKRVVVHDLRTGARKEVTDKFEGIEFHDS
jgi:dipeptidyl aminopeptidase/acylaminoacyl peptidase